MKLTYDPRYNIAYLQLQEKVGPVQTLSLSGEINVDISPDGKLFGIELLNANEQLWGDGDGMMTVVNEAIQEQRQIPLAK